jgi:hypothetical protein
MGPSDPKSATADVANDIADSDATSAASSPQPRCPTLGELKRCFIERHGCRREERSAIFKGEDNADLTVAIRPRLVSPSGGFVSDIDGYPDAEEATPSMHDFFCRSLGFVASEVNPAGPDGEVTSELPSVRARRGKMRVVTRADGGTRRK